MGTVGAVGIPDTVTVTTSKDWVVANNADQSTITITVSNTTPGYNGRVPGVTVNLAVNSSYGTLSPATVITNDLGNSPSIITFQTKTKSGAPQITATLPGYPAVSGSVIQNIDHDTPYYDPSFSLPLFIYPVEGTAATEIPFKISMHDRGGNPIDNRRGTHLVSLHVNSPLTPDDCGFENGSSYSHDISLPLDADGALTVNVKLTNKTGINYIQMDSIGAISFKTISINVVAGGMPVSMSGSISDDGRLPANNVDKFTLDYYLYDVYGNPMANRSIWISTNISGEQTPTLHTSDSNGLIRFYYGPTIQILTANITAVAYDNPALKSELIAHFVSDEATNLVLALTPQIMGSLDVDSGSSAFVRATVVDDFGNPVKGKLVTFSLGTPTPVDVMTTPPTLVSTSATSDYDGNAIVLFHPGTFPKFGEENYNSAATGTVVITATWEGISKHVTATWKNYPYINIETSADPTSNIKLNDTIDVSIEVTGNGYYMNGGQGKVASLVDIDSSSTIWSNSNGTPGYKRIDSAKEAAKAFAAVLLTPPPTNNWIGLNSFGNEKKDDDRLLSPQTDFSLVENKINNLVRGTNSQEFGQSIIDSINNLSESQDSRPPDKFRAVVVIKDSGGGNLENSQRPNKDDIITLANSTHPKTMVYTVYYYDGTADNTSTINVLRDISTGTGGEYFRAENTGQLIQTFDDLAHIIQNRVGVNVTLDVNFKNIEVNGTSMSGSQVFSYVPVGTPYTLHADGLSRDEVSGRTRIMWPNTTNSVFDQSDEWNANQHLQFNIGTVNISDRWNTTYRFKVNQTGLINIFNCSLCQSVLSYDDGTGSGPVDRTTCLPDLNIIVNPNSTPSVVQTLDISDLTPQSGSFTDTVPLHWTLKYDGYGTVTETYLYSYMGQEYVVFGSTSGIPSTNGLVVTHSTKLDVTKFPPGDYTIKVIATVPGIPLDSVTGGFTKPASSDGGPINIQLR